METVLWTKYLEKPQYLALVREASIDAHLLDLGHEDLVFVIVIVIVIVIVDLLQWPAGVSL